MALTLQDMREGASDKVAEQVVDTFLRESEILQMITFDDTVSPQGGSTLTYSYLQKQIPSTAAFRKLNEEYTDSEAKLVKKSADLKIFGGKFRMDRVLKKAENKFNNMAFQMEEKIAAAVSLFHYTLINGDSTTQEDSFDGLDKMLVGTTSEFNSKEIIDVSNIEKMKTSADQLYEALQVLIRETGADALLMNTSMISKVQTMARILGYKTETEEAFGKKVTSMDGVRFMDLKNHSIFRYLHTAYEVHQPDSLAVHHYCDHPLEAVSDQSLLVPDYFPNQNELGTESLSSKSSHQSP